MPRLRKREGLTAVGITSGIGSMLVGARQAGFQVLGNIEWRRYYHRKDTEGRSTFLENFQGAFMKQQIADLTEDELQSIIGADLVMGHPECGPWSRMQSCNNFRSSKQRKVDPKKPCDIPLFTGLVRKLRPRFFVMDDLPKSLGAYSMKEYARELDEYDLFPEWISNWHYGNTQKNRKRMFMIGSLKSERFIFFPGEAHHEETVRSVIEDLWLHKHLLVANHEGHTLKEKSGRALHMDYLWHRPIWADVRRWFMDKPDGTIFEYHSPSGGIKKKPGWAKIRWNEHCYVLDGGSGYIHPKRNLPLTIRERARLQGFPDSFIFYGTKLNDRGEWNHELNMDLLKQTGKAMPIQFCRYVSQQVFAHIQGTPFHPSGKRLVKSNVEIDEAKKWYCKNIGYSDQKKVCRACWLPSSCPLTSLQKIGAGVPPPKKGGSKTRGVKKGAARKNTGGKKSQLPSTRVPGGKKIRIQQFNLGEPEQVPVSFVRVRRGVVPKKYHCRCQFCMRSLGELRQADGSYYSRLERRRYYDQSERGRTGHIAKTPLHIARWAVQQYTKKGDWVLDPTIGSGTTAVEALIQERNAAGVELQFGQILEANMHRFTGKKLRAVIGYGDARGIGQFLPRVRRKFSLILNNPPYSGDEHAGVGMSDDRNDWTTKYDHRLPNIAFLKEGEKYWETIEDIYRQCIRFLSPGGRFVVGVKDQMRQKKPDQLHERFAEVLESIGLEHEGTAFLRHYPGTLHLHTYFKRYGVHPPYYQTILVFRKGG